jgi:hypothetical protein
VDGDTPEPLLPPDTDDGDEPIREPLPAPRRARWKYFATPILLCALVAALITFGLLFASLAVLVLAAGVLLWFTYWLFFSRRGIIRRLVRHRRLEGRRRERWMRRAAERGHKP